MSAIGKKPKVNLPGSSPERDVEQPEQPPVDVARIQRGICIQILRDEASSAADRFRALDRLQELERAKAGSEDRVSSAVSEMSDSGLTEILDGLWVVDVCRACLEGVETLNAKAEDFPVTSAYLDDWRLRRTQELAEKLADKDRIEQEIAAKVEARVSYWVQREMSSATGSEPPPPPPGIDIARGWSTKKSRRRRLG